MMSHRALGVVEATSIEDLQQEMQSKMHLPDFQMHDFWVLDRWWGGTVFYHTYSYNGFTGEHDG